MDVNKQIIFRICTFTFIILLFISSSLSTTIAKAEVDESLLLVIESDQSYLDNEKNQELRGSDMIATIENAKIAENKIINEEEKHSLNNSLSTVNNGNESGINLLPNSATWYYNWVFSGVVLIMIAMAIPVIEKIRKQNDNK